MQAHARERMPEWKTRYEGAEEPKLAVMGCVVNGPGESRAANCRIPLPGTGESHKAPVFVDGQKVAKLQGDDIVPKFKIRLEEYVVSHYDPGQVAAHG